VNIIYTHQSEPTSQLRFFVHYDYTSKHNKIKKERAFILHYINMY